MFTIIATNLIFCDHYSSFNGHPPLLAAGAANAATSVRAVSRRNSGAAHASSKWDDIWDRNVMYRFALVRKTGHVKNHAS
jgi:hypothetical protein